MRKLYATSAATIATFVIVVYPRTVPAVSAPPDPPPGAISVVSLNMAKERDCQRIITCLRNSPRLAKADVLLLQEVSDTADAPSVAEQVASRLGYFSAFSREAQGVYDRGLAVMSRYPISGMSVQRLKQFNLRYHSRNRFAMSLTVQSPQGPVRFWNVHLDTRLNADQRLEQLRPVIEDASRQTGPRVIGGDLNTNDFYWIGNIFPFPAGSGHGATIRSQMDQRGFRTPFVDGLVTFPGFRRHLDWVYASDLRTVGSSVEPVAFSDHHALWAAMVADR